jgi:hypothetical protein
MAGLSASQRPCRIPRMEVAPLADRTLGSPDGDFVVVEWEDDGS